MNILRASDCQGLLSMADAVELSKQAFVHLSTPDQTYVPERHIFDMPTDRYTVMSAEVGRGELFGSKLLTVFPGNVRRNLARINAMVIVMDAENGLVDTIIDGTWLTAFRTGAACGASIEVLARADAGVLTVFGAGPVAYMSVLAAAAVRPLHEVRICNRDADKGNATAQKLSQTLGVQVWRTDDAAAAVTDTDIVVTATNTTEALLPDSLLPAGIHIAALGGGYPNHELSPQTMARATIFVDSRATADRECGDIRNARSALSGESLTIKGELGEVILSKLAGRTTANELTIFESCGSAVQDLVVGSALAHQARLMGIGINVPAFHAGF